MELGCCLTSVVLPPPPAEAEGDEFMCAQLLHRGALVLGGSQAVWRCCKTLQGVHRVFVGGLVVWTTLPCSALHIAYLTLLLSDHFRAVGF